MRTLLSKLLLSFFAILHQTLAVPQPEPQQQKPKLPTWTLTPTPSTQQFRGLFPIAGSRHNSHNQPQTIWLSGTNGTVLLSTNTGSTWTNVSPNLAPENATNFQFRDIHGWDSKRAAILSIGEGNLSRVYVTSDSGKTWKQTFVNEEESAFYDCMAFESEPASASYGNANYKSNHGIAMSDPVNGKFRLLETWDGGDSWSILPSDSMTPALPGEFGFAASGTCIEARQGRWYIATGGVDPGRILRSSDGRMWSASDSAIVGGAAAGVFSVRFRDGKVGVAVGGDFEKPTQNVNNSAFSVDGGRTWTRSSVFPGGYRSGVSWVPGRKNTAVAVGTSGSDVTFDGGRTWFGLGNDSFDAVECVEGGVCWGSGARGRVGMLAF